MIWPCPSLFFPHLQPKIFAESSQNSQLQKTTPETREISSEQKKIKSELILFFSELIFYTSEPIIPILPKSPIIPHKITFKNLAITQYRHPVITKNGLIENDEPVIGF